MDSRAGELASRMTIQSARVVFEAWWEAVPDEPGVYAVFLDEGAEFYDRARNGAFTWSSVKLGDLMLVNIGSTTRMTLRRRINHHLFGDSRVSSLRRSLAALFGPREMTPCGRPGAFSYHLGEWEGWITDFLVEYGHFGWMPSENPAKEEFELIRRHMPPLNIKGLEQTPFAQHLLQLRREWADAARL